MKRWMLLALALGATASARAETVTLRFAWPAGVVADVSFTGWRERVVNERRARREVGGGYVLSTRRVGDGLLVDVSDMRVDDPPSMERDQSDLLQDMVARLSSVSPDTVVGDDGSLLRVVGADETAGTLRAAIVEALGDAPEDLRERVSQALDAMLSARRVEATVRSNWGRDIGVWVNLVVEPGRRYEGEVDVPVPMLPGATAPATVRYSLAELLPCPPPAADRECAVLEMRTSVSDESAAAVVERLAAGLSARTGREVRIDALAVDNRVRLVTEPATLLPHVIEYEQGTSITLVSEGAPARSVSQSEQRTTRYRYR